MEKENKVIIISIIGVILVLFGISYELINSKKTEVSKTNPSVEPSKNPEIKEEIVIISKEESLKIIKSIYDIEGLTIDFKEENNECYIFEQKNSTGVLFNTFKFNKATGQIIQEENVNAAPNF